MILFYRSGMKSTSSAFIRRNDCRKPETTECAQPLCEAIVRALIEDVLMPGGDLIRIDDYISAETYIQPNEDVPDGRERSSNIGTIQNAFPHQKHGSTAASLEATPQQKRLTEHTALPASNAKNFA